MRFGEQPGVDYLTTEELLHCGARGWHDVLGVALFSSHAVDVDAAGVPIARVVVPALGNESALFEVWRAHGPFESGQAGLVHYRSNGRLLFGCVTLSEAPIAKRTTAAAALQQAVERAYVEIFRCLEAVGFPHLLRVWNYLAEINREIDGKERYQQFNAARQRAFLMSGRNVTGNLPAACALGSAPGSPFVVYFLASTTSGSAIENPRQVAAYEYPPQYGTSSPTFSRATLSHGTGAPLLLVSGTSSIVGHSSVHADDVVSQTRETMANIQALIVEANRTAREERFALKRLTYKVYLRHAADLAVALHELRQTLPSDAPIVFIQADVCRTDLLVEVEAVGDGRSARGH